MTGPELRYPFSALVSYHYYPDPEQIAGLATGGLRLIGDSGAFSAHTSGKPINLDTFAAWAHATRDSTTWTAGLDVIGDADGTWDNWQALRSLDLDPIPTVHYGSPPSVLDRYAEQGVDFVGLGGMVGRKSESDRLLRWCLSMMRYARDTWPGMRFHGWGVTHPSLVQNLPWWSVDSSGFGQSYRFGRLKLWDPVARRHQTAALDGREPYRHGALLRRHYSVTPEQVATSTPANRRTLIRVSAYSFQLLEDYLRARHQVTPPTYGLRSPSLCGPSLHAVDGSVGNLSVLCGPSVHAALSGEDLHLTAAPTEGTRP